MNKREFLFSAAGLVTCLPSVGAEVNKRVLSQVILTMVGDIQKVNRNKFDSVFDQLMYKHGIQFDRAYALSLNDLEKFPVTTIKPTLEYDGKVHQLSGPRLMDVLGAVGINNSDGVTIKLHGIDGYSPEISLASAKKYDYILATKLDGRLLSVGGFGPLFAIYDADRLEEFSKKPLDQRFAACPWGLYCIEVIKK